VAVDRFNDPPQNRGKGVIPKGPEEVANRKIVGHAVLRYVRDDDLYVPAAVPMSPGRQDGARDPGQLWRDLDTDDPAEAPPGGLMHNSTFSTPELDESVLVRDSGVTERPGKHVPGRRHVVHSIVTRVVVHMDSARRVDPPVEQAVSEPLERTICGMRDELKTMSQAPSPRYKPAPQSTAARPWNRLPSLFMQPARQLFPSSRRLVG
jgi:hypothetical protein